MLKAVFEPTRLVLTSDKTGKGVEIPYADHPAIFSHPRFLLADFDAAEALLRQAYKQLRESWVIAPKVSVSVQKPLEGGLSGIDERYLKEIFTHAGAREVLLT